MQTRLKYWAGDHMGYLDALAALLKKCRLKCRAASKAVKEGTLSDETVVPMWKERGARITLIIASQMVEMKVYPFVFLVIGQSFSQFIINFCLHLQELSAAVKLLEPLASQPEASPALRSSIARIYLQGGYFPAAKIHIETVEADPNADEHLKRMNKALFAAAESEWTGATDSLEEFLENDAENYVVCFSILLISFTLQC